jgi:hypothetical protein
MAFPSAGLFVRGAAVLGALVLLAGCQTAAQKAMCPVVNVLANTAQRTIFKKGMEGDPSGELYTVEVTGAADHCDFDKDEGTTNTTVDVTFRATRAPSGDAVNATVPYYVVSVMNGNNVLQKKIVAASFTFQPGEASTTFTATYTSLLTHLETGKKPYEYGVLVGIQLTREELDYANKRQRLIP